MSDTISRQAAVDALIAEGRNVDSHYLESERIIVESDAVEALSILPSADRPKGMWVFDTQISIGKGAYSAGYRCSICEKDYFRVEGMNFCPNCGADMRTKEYERAVDQLKHDMLYEPTFNQDDGSV